MEGHHALASVRAVRRFLTELANTADDGLAVNNFHKQYGRVIPGPIWMIEHREVLTPAGVVYRSIPGDRRILEFRDAVRRAWELRDGRAKLYALIPLLAPFAHGPGSSKSDIERALWYLLDHPHATRVCRNPTCPTHYFVVARRNQRYCCEECAKPTPREAKRRWWREVGRDWRHQRRSGNTHRVRR